MDSPESDSDHDKAVFKSPFSLYSNVRNACKGMRKARTASAHYDLEVSEDSEQTNLEGKKHSTEL